MKKPEGGLNKLESLMRGGSSAPASRESDPEDEALFVADVQKVLDFVATIVGADIFAAQELIEGAAEELRIQIRDDVVGGS
jgi:hypothetical protein